MIQKIAKAACDLIGNKMLIKLQVSKTLPQNSSETNEKEILREKHISPEQGQKIIDDLGLI